MDLLTFLIVVMILMAVGVSPLWSYSRNWGYYPLGGSGLLVVVLVVLLVLGYRP